MPPNGADEHHYLTGDDLARAITDDHLPWDPSVQALLPFPSVLEMMASDMNWTSELGNAFLAQQQDVMDAVQQERKKGQWTTATCGPTRRWWWAAGPYITILPVNPAFVCVPVYDPLVVFYPPRPGFFVGGAIGFGFGITLGFAFRPWGWGISHFFWDRHELCIGDARWGRNWVNRGCLRASLPRRPTLEWAARPEEHHERIPRSEAERSAARTGHARVEEHHAARMANTASNLGETPVVSFQLSVFSRQLTVKFLRPD